MLRVKQYRKKGKVYYAFYEGKRYVGNANEVKYQKYLRDKAKVEAGPRGGSQETPDMPTGKYDVIYADPPWRYDFDVDSRATENHYPTLLLRDICRLRDGNKVHIQDVFDANAVLYLWATAPKLNEALEVIKAWGFTYKTNMVWTKDKIGLGWYCRNQHELLLIAEKGEMPLPEPSVRPPSVMEYPRTTHSTKPPEIYAEIERWYPKRRYLEVFGVANDARPKTWIVFGNAVYE